MIPWRDIQACLAALQPLSLIDLRIKKNGVKKPDNLKRLAHTVLCGSLMSETIPEYKDLALHPGRAITLKTETITSFQDQVADHIDVYREAVAMELPSTFTSR